MAPGKCSKISRTYSVTKKLWLVIGESVIFSVEKVSREKTLNLFSICPAIWKTRPSFCFRIESGWFKEICLRVGLEM